MTEPERLSIEIYTEDTLREAIQKLLQTPPGVAPWEESWAATRLLFSLHPYLDENNEYRDLQEQLHQRLEAHRAALERMAPKQWLQAVDETLVQLQHEFEQIVGTTTDKEEALHQLQRLQQLQRELDALQWLTMATREEESFSIAEAFADLSLIEREISQLRRQARRERKPSPHHAPLQALDARLRALRRELLARESNYFLQTTDELLPSLNASQPLASTSVTRARSRLMASRPKRLSSTTSVEKQPPTNEIKLTPSQDLGIEASSCWESLLQGESLLLAIHLEAEADEHKQLKPLLEGLERRQQQLKTQLQEALTPMTNDARRSWCVSHIPQMTDEIDEHLAALDELDMDEAIVHLRHMEAQMTWLQGIVKPLKEKGTPSHKAFAETLKQVKRLHRRLRAESQEKKLQAKLEAKFGHKAVSFSENLILVLIFLVVVFLTIEYVFKPPEIIKLALMWADTVICAIFLAEFFTKLAYAEGKGLYFRRHFLIDFLPSIPFSLFFWMLSGPAVSHVAAGRAARLVRISRLTRYIRILRPMIRIFRVLTFLMRALDRLVRKYETVFNRNVLLFPAPEDRRRAQEITPETRIQQLRERCRKRMRMQINKMEPEARLLYLAHRTGIVENQLSSHEGESRQQGIIKQSTEVVNFDQLIDKMLSIDEIEVEEILGEAFIQQTTRMFQFIAAPGVRSMPGLRRMARAYQELSPAALVAWFIQGLGRVLEQFQRIFHWIGDLYGIVTGPQVLDRIGMTLINATLRPAKRLLIFGLLFLIVTLFIQAFSIGWLHDAARFLTKFLGAPIIILGFVSLIPLALGFWFRMIAGETTDFFARISEAQFIARLKQVKQQKSSYDLKHLVLRVLHPEAMLRNKPMQPPDQLVEQLQGQLGQQGASALHAVASHGSLADLPQPWTQEFGAFQGTQPLPAHNPALKIESQPHQTDWSERDRILLLYEDYLDGTPLHRSDTKTTNHLLGNITIQNIRKHRLGLNLVQNLRIEKLDLSRPRLLLYFGPYLWFASITESLTHRIARLIVEYNQNCIPQEELAWLDQDERDEYESWIDRREKRLSGVPLPPLREKKDEREFRTTAFTALHFLSVEVNRDKAVERLFGHRVVALMQAERRLLMRELFGYFPYHQLPKDHRTFNIFQSYQSHVARGRFFLLPFKMVWWFGQLIVWSVMRVHKLVRDVLQPPSQVETEVQGKAGFDVAIRKINRMRKPIYTECMRLRAAFDLEYLGFFLPGRHHSGLEGSNYNADLDFIDASARERLEFEHLRTKREGQLQLFEAFLSQHGWDEANLTETLTAIHPDLAAKHGEVLRALTAAFASDYKHVRSLLEAHEASLAFFGAAPDIAFTWTGWQSFKDNASRLFKTMFFLREDKERTRFERAWLTSSAREDKPKTPQQLERDWCRYLSVREQLQDHLKLLAEYERHPHNVAKEIFEDVIQHSSIWTEELLTLRTLQTLTQLDIQLYRELVHTIGEYED